MKDEGLQGEVHVSAPVKLGTTVETVIEPRGTAELHTDVIQFSAADGGFAAGWTDGAGRAVECDVAGCRLRVRGYGLRTIADEGYRLRLANPLAFAAADAQGGVENEQGIAFVFTHRQRVGGTDLHAKSAQGAVFGAGDGGQ